MVAWMMLVYYPERLKNPLFCKHFPVVRLPLDLISLVLKNNQKSRFLFHFFLESGLWHGKA